MAIKWTVAKTYAKIAHEYILQEDYPAEFARAKKKIAEQGTREPFTLRGKTNYYKYLYTKKHRYWIIWDVLNRDARYGTGKGKIKPSAGKGK